MTLSSRQTQALAASFVALLVAAPLALKYSHPNLGSFSSKTDTKVAASSAQNLGASGKAESPQTQPELVAPTKPEPKSSGELTTVEAPARPGATSVPAQPQTANSNSASEINIPAGSPPPVSTASDHGKLVGSAAARLQHALPPAPVATAPPPPLSVVPLAEPQPEALAAKPKLRLQDAELGRRFAEGDAMRAAPGIAQAPNPYIWMGNPDDQRQTIREENRDKFNAQEINPVKQAAIEPVSTFSIDVDTASYSFARRALNAGHLPPKDSIRVEEMINYFPYNYPAPESAETPFKPTVTVMPSPWNVYNQLVHVGIKGYDLKSAERPRANLVLLMDVSGSMEPADRLPLVKNAFRLLVDQLKPDDTIGIVTYASGAGIALEPTRVADKAKILAAIESLGAGGSTAGAEGIQDAYRLAETNFDKRAVNRIILATDGDFNVGITDQNELKSYIERKRQSGIFLSILGVGQGNHNDALMQTLAQNGNGTAAYADTLSEARKVLVEESSSTLFTIAKDVKVQIEWNPQRVAEYRLIGYESRALKREDFNNDRIDAGDIGSGHTVTAIYEVTPVGAPVLADELRYGKKASSGATELQPRNANAADSKPNELGFLKLRYKRPNEDVSKLIELAIPDLQPKPSLAQAPDDVRFSVAVAEFGQLLRGTPYTQGASFDDVLSLAQSARGDDPFGYRAEFLNLVRLAKSARP